MTGSFSWPQNRAKKCGPFPKRCLHTLPFQNRASLHPGPALSRNEACLVHTPHPHSLRPTLFLERAHLVVEGAIGSTLCCGHAALIPHAHSHIRVNIDSHQFLGLKYCNPDLGKECKRGKRVRPAWIRREPWEVPRGLEYGTRAIPGSPGLCTPGRDPHGAGLGCGCREA